LVSRYETVQPGGAKEAFVDEFQGHAEHPTQTPIELKGLVTGMMREERGMRDLTGTQMLLTRR
jgi:hypothetical protein